MVARRPVVASRARPGTRLARGTAWASRPDRAGSAKALIAPVRTAAPKRTGRAWPLPAAPARPAARRARPVVPSRTMRRRGAAVGDVAAQEDQADGGRGLGQAQPA